MLNISLLYAGNVHSVPGFPLTFLQARVWNNYLSLKVWDEFATIGNKAFLLNPILFLCLINNNEIDKHYSVSPEVTMAPSRTARGCQHDEQRVAKNSATAQRRGGPRPNPQSTAMSIEIYYHYYYFLNNIRTQRFWVVMRGN